MLDKIERLRKKARKEQIKRYKETGLVFIFNVRKDVKGNDYIAFYEPVVITEDYVDYGVLYGHLYFIKDRFPRKIYNMLEETLRETLEINKKRRKQDDKNR